MEEPVKDRRKVSYSGLLDSAIRMATQLTTSNDPNTRSLSSRLLADLLQMRREIPSRRQLDNKVHKGQ